MSGLLRHLWDCLELPRLGLPVKPMFRFRKTHSLAVDDAVTQELD